MRKKLGILSLSFILLTGFTLTGCGGTPLAEEPTASEATTEATTEATDPAAEGTSGKKYAMVFGGSLGDKGFIDEGYAGLKQAEEELGITFDYAECKAPSDFEPQLRLFAEAGEYELILGHGANFLDSMKVLAKEYPEQKFVLVDGILDEDLPNMSSIGAIDEEQAFLSGVLAGLATIDERMPLANAENIIGYEIGMDSPVSRATAAGFVSGAKYVNPEVEVITSYVGSYKDPGKAKEIGLMMYGRGADIVSHNAGASHVGLFEAAAEQQKYAIGTSKASVHPESSLCTSLKHIDTLIFNEIKSTEEGTWAPGVKRYGIKEGICDIDFEGTTIEIPQDILDTVEDVKQQVINGEVAPANDLDQIDEWTKNNQYVKD